MGWDYRAWFAMGLPWNRHIAKVNLPSQTHPPVGQDGAGDALLLDHRLELLLRPDGQALWGGTMSKEIGEKCKQMELKFF